MLFVFAACAALMAWRKLPALLAVPLMALAVAALGGSGWHGVASVAVDGTVQLKSVIITVILGAWLSRVTMATGIAETIVNYAAEFGGDRPIVLALSLCAAVAFLFTSLAGLGAIIMVGSIVLPVMMTIGIPRKLAATLFLMSFALGFIFNISQWKFYTETFNVDPTVLHGYAIVLAGIDLVALIVFAVIGFRKQRGYATWALATDEPLVRKRVPWYALLAPVLPIVLYYAFNMNPIPAFALAAIYGALAAQPRRTVETLVAAAIRGVEDVAPAVLLFMGIGMLLVATRLPEVKLALEPVIAAIAPRGAFGYIVLFGLASPLALYRGPLNPVGVGIGVYAVLAGLGILPPAALVAAIMAVSQVQNVCDPTNTQNVWVANFTGVRVEEILRATLPYQVAVATAAAIAVALFGSAFFGVPVFHAGTPAGAATVAHVAAGTLAPVAAPAAVLAAPSSPIVVPPSAAVATASPAPVAAPAGLFSPAAAARTLAFTRGDDALSTIAVETIRRAIDGGWRGFRTLELAEDPSASDCARKAYAATGRAVVTLLGEAPRAAFDLGLFLDDCAGWPVEQWHIVRACSVPPPADEVRDAALAALVRLRTWMHERPAPADALFSRGLAFDERSAPQTFFYTLFKTNDGQMRAFVRPGGPAWAAGMRTNDIVVKLDGKFWWEYGTFQTQRRAYDGLPHTFLVTTGVNGPERTVTLGLPYPTAQ